MNASGFTPHDKECPRRISNGRWMKYGQKGRENRKEDRTERRKAGEAQGNTMNTGINRNQRNQIFIKQLPFRLLQSFVL